MPARSYKQTQQSRNPYRIGHAVPDDQKGKRFVPDDTPAKGFRSGAAPSGIGNKELPILLMLDASLSMAVNNRMDQQNEAIKQFLKALCQQSRVRDTAQVGFCLFTGELVYTTEFMPLNNLQFHESEFLKGVASVPFQYTETGKLKEFMLNVPVFAAAKRGSTDIPMAVESAIDAMQAHVAELVAEKKQKYVPFLVFTSDGNPDLHQGINDKYTDEVRRNYMSWSADAARRLSGVCGPDCPINELIIPFFIGIGDAERSYLRLFCKDFEEGVLMVNEENYLEFATIAERIAAAIAKSVVMQDTTKKLLTTLKEIINAVQDA